MPPNRRTNTALPAPSALQMVHTDAAAASGCWGRSAAPPSDLVVQAPPSDLVVQAPLVLQVSPGQSKCHRHQQRWTVLHAQQHPSRMLLHAMGGPAHWPGRINTARKAFMVPRIARSDAAAASGGMDRSAVVTSDLLESEQQGPSKIRQGPSKIQQGPSRIQQGVTSLSASHTSTRRRRTSAQSSTVFLVTPWAHSRSPSGSRSGRLWSSACRSLSCFSA